ncbi:unnamed protein product [Rhodiola kirilowii]
MEGNVCDSSHLDEDVLPPPRKRLLAGFKKQSDNDQSRASSSASPPPIITELHTRVKNLLSSHLIGGSSSSSLEELAESSKKAASAAAKAAEAARAAAEEKATIAARAIAAAKSALELLAAFSEETSGRGRHTKKNKSKKQVMVHSLYKKHSEVENCNTERKLLHYKHSQPSLDSKSLKHKKPKTSPVIEKTKFPNEGKLEGVSRDMCNSKATLDTEGSILENETGSQCLTKLISSNWTSEKDIVTQKRKARKQLIRMVERQVDLS